MKNKSKLLLSLLALILVGCSVNDNHFNSSFFTYYDESFPISEKYKDYGENPFLSVSEQPLSTFSIDADGASYTNMRRFLYLGQLPPVASVRIEEFINYFTFDYDEPTSGENVSLNAEIATCPWNAEHHLMRLGIKGKTIPVAEMVNSNYVFLIDVSGSMGSPDKLAVLKSGFIKMTDGLNAGDKVAIVTYAGAAGVLLNSTDGSQKATIKAAINKLGAGGTTAGAEGIISAYDIAQKNFIQNGNNRIILGTDGDFNVGVSNTEDLIKLIEKKRESGIYLTVLGVGDGNLNDEMMEQVADKGNGNYEYIDNAAQLQKVFVNEKAKFHTVAKDCKIQISFDSTMVASYRLIGYENRALENEDFEKDSTDAGELGATQTITAVYEVVLKKLNADKPYAKFDFRYKRTNETVSRPMNLDVQMLPVNMNIASQNMRFAAAITGFGLLMKESEYKGTLTKQMVLDLANQALTFDPFEYRKEFVELVKNLN